MDREAVLYLLSAAPFPLRYPPYRIMGRWFFHGDEEFLNRSHREKSLWRIKADGEVEKWGDSK